MSSITYNDIRWLNILFTDKSFMKHRCLGLSVCKAALEDNERPQDILQMSQ